MIRNDGTVNFEIVYACRSKGSGKKNIVVNNVVVRVFIQSSVRIGYRGIVSEENVCKLLNLYNAGHRILKFIDGVISINKFGNGVKHIADIPVHRIFLTYLSIGHIHLFDLIYNIKERVNIFLNVFLFTNIALNEGIGKLILNLLGQCTVSPCKLKRFFEAEIRESANA